MGPEGGGHSTVGGGLPPKGGNPVGNDPRRDGWQPGHLGPARGYGNCPPPKKIQAQSLARAKKLNLAHMVAGARPSPKGAGMTTPRPQKRPGLNSPAPPPARNEGALRAWEKAKKNYWAPPFFLLLPDHGTYQRCRRKRDRRQPGVAFFFSCIPCRRICRLRDPERVCRRVSIMALTSLCLWATIRYLRGWLIMEEC